MMRLISLLCIATLCTSIPAFADTQWTRTGPNGGTATGTQSCSGGGGGGYACSGQSTYIGPEGRTGTRTWQGTGTREGGQRTTTTTRPSGEPRTRTFTWQRN